MIYGQKPKYRKNGCSCSEAPKFYDILNMENVHRLSPAGEYTIS